MQLSVELEALLLTENKDFGELTHRLRLQHHGVLLIRILESTGKAKLQYVAEAIQKHGIEMIDAFSVLSGDKLRIKRRIQ